MAKNVFISFRYSDGHQYKDILSQKFDMHYDTVDFSEDEDRSMMSENTIRNYLYSKLKRSSVTIILLTPEAVNHKKNMWGEYDDWMYDEIRYSLENRDGNRTNGLVAVYTKEAEKYLIDRSSFSDSITIKSVDNLFRRNMMNVKQQYKKNPMPGVYDMLEDSFCSLVSFESFSQNITKYIENASKKRDEKFKYDIKCRLQ